MARNPDANSLSKAQSGVRPPEVDPQWSQAASQAAPLLPPDELIWLCPMLSTDYTPGCHFNDYGSDDCYAVDPSDPTYPGHTGIDLVDSAGKGVYPIAVGTVVAVQAVDDGEFGTWVWVRHQDKTHTRIIDSIYAHVTPEAGIVAGVAVVEETLIATVASPTTGSSTAPHLHLSIVVHDVANAANGWEATELSGYDTNVYTWYTGHIVNPLDYITCDKFCCEDDIIEIAAAPPPAQNPPLGSLPLPYWRPFPKWPLSPGPSNSLYSLIEGNHGGWPSWLAGVYLNTGTATIYPFLDSPTGKIRVAGVVTVTPGVQYQVWLEHHDHLLTWYRWLGNSATLAVAKGDWIDAGTALGTVTRSSGSKLVEWGVYMRAASAVAFTPDNNPETEYNDDSVHPACFLWPEGSWTDWPNDEYKALPAASKCLGYGLGGLA